MAIAVLQVHPIDITHLEQNAIGIIEENFHHEKPLQVNRIYFASYYEALFEMGT